MLRENSDIFQTSYLLYTILCW